MASPSLVLCLVVVSFSIVSSNEVKLDDAGDCLPENRTSLVEALSSTIRRCINMTSTTFPGFTSNLQQSECFAYTEAFCKSLPTVRQCVDEEGSRWSHCSVGNFGKVFSLFKDAMKDTLDDLCEDNGEKLSRFLYSFNRNTLDYRARNAFVGECLLKVSYRMGIADRSGANFPTKYWYIHKEIGKFKNCISEHFQADNETVNEALQYMDRTLDSMKCPHPENESEVLCKDLDSGINRTDLCPLKTTSERIPLSLLLQTRLSSCMVQYESHTPVLSEARSLEDFEDFFRNYCRRQGRINYCISETSSAAEVCLSSDAHDIYKLVRNYVELILEGICYQQGRRLARMMHITKGTGDSNSSVADCLKLAPEGRSWTMDDPARVYGYYQEISVIKNCVLGKVEETDEEEFRKDVTEFINLIDERMMCFHPDDRSVVLCKTIEST